MTRLPGLHPLQKYAQDYLTFGGLRVNLQRTCRVPLGELNSLPAGLGSFPVYKVADFKSGVPLEWREDGYFFPMYRQEAMWINFARGYMENPKALIVGAGNINAVNGKPFFASSPQEKLEVRLEKEQNYLVVPPQPWLDGWKAEDGKIYQFVAAEMGSGETVEGQITGEEKIGGLQFLVFDPKEGQKLIHKTRPHEYIIGGCWGGYEGTLPGHSSSIYASDIVCAAAGAIAPIAMRSPQAVKKAVTSMGLGRGGEIEQKIYPDPYGIEVWKELPTAVEVIYMVSSEDFKQVTGYDAPPTPVTYEKYQQYGLPWFELHDQKYKDTKGSDIFAKLKPVGEGKAKKVLTAEDVL